MRWLAALALLAVLAQPAGAMPRNLSGVLVMEMSDVNTQSSLMHADHQKRMLRTLNVGGGDLFFGRSDRMTSAAACESLRVGAYLTPAGWRRFAAVIHLAYVDDVSKGNFAPEQFSIISSRAPVVPHLFLGNANLAAALNGDSASTGATSGAITATRDSSHLAYIPGTASRWLSPGQITYLRVAASTFQIRALVGYTAGRMTERPVHTCQDCITDKGSIADTLIAWEKDFLDAGAPIIKTVAGIADTIAPVLFCVFGSQTNGSGLQILPVLGRLDSLTRGKVFPAEQITRTDNGNQGPRDFAIAITHGGTLRYGDAEGLLDVDTTYAKATVRDSIDNLGVPYTIQIPVDSLAHYGPWFDGLKNARFVPAIYGLLFDVGASYGNASLAAYPADPLGKSRTRYSWRGDAADTASTAVLWRASYDILRLRYGVARVDPVMIFPLGYQRKADGQQADSILAALDYAGVKGFTVDTRAVPVSLVQEPGTSSTAPNFAASSAGWHRSSISFNDGEPQRIRALDFYTGDALYFSRALLVSLRGGWNQTIYLDRNYIPDHGADVYRTQFGLLGQTEPGTSGAPYLRPGFYHIKWLVMAVQAANAKRWAGSRPIVRIVPLGDMAASPVRRY